MAPQKAAKEGLKAGKGYDRLKIADQFAKEAQPAESTESRLRLATLPAVLIRFSRQSA